MKTLVYFVALLLTTINVVIGQQTQQVNSLTLYFSQQTVVNPCTGSPVVFDFGMLRFHVQRSNSDIHGTIDIQATLRDDGVSHLQKNSGSFSASVDADDTSYDAYFRYDVPKTSMVTLYHVQFSLNANSVVSASLQDIQFAGC